jgi:hypothetical protein
MEQPTKKLKSFRSWDDLEAAQVEHQDEVEVYIALARQRIEPLTWWKAKVSRWHETFWQPQQPASHVSGFLAAARI